MGEQMLGIIDATIDVESLNELTDTRSLGAVPFAGRYRFIDFMLSSMVNSDIRSVAIFAGTQTRSLMDHLGSGKPWDLDRKRDGLFVFTQCNQGQKFNWKECYECNMDYLLRAKQKYVVIANSHVLGCIDFQKVLKRHIETGADITELFYEGETLTIYMIERKLLISLFTRYEDEVYDSLIGFIERCKKDLIQREYDVPGYLISINSIESYYEKSLSILEPAVWEKTFAKGQPVYTKVKDEPPTKYTKDAEVKNAIIANGCIIEGTVENSILFRAVKVGKGSIIRNSVIMQKCQIGENCIIDGVVFDKDVKIEDGVNIIGTKGNPYIVAKGTVQGALMSS